MRPQKRVVKQTSKQFEPHASPSKHLMMSDKKAKSDKKLGKTKKKQAERKKILRAEVKKNETADEKEEKKETERKKIWRQKQKPDTVEKSVASEAKSNVIKNKK